MRLAVVRPTASREGKPDAIFTLGPGDDVSRQARMVMRAGGTSRRTVASILPPDGSIEVGTLFGGGKLAANGPSLTPRMACPRGCDEGGVKAQ